MIDSLVIRLLLGRAGFYLWVLGVLFPCVAMAQVQDLEVSVEQFSRIEDPGMNVNRIQKGITTEVEFKQWFGDGFGILYFEEKDSAADIEEAKTAFDEIVKQHVPAYLNPKYPFPTVDQKFLYQVLPWTFEHPVSCQSVKGDCSQHANLVLFVTVNKKTGIIEEFQSFDFNFEKKLAPEKKK